MIFNIVYYLHFFCSNSISKPTAMFRKNLFIAFRSLKKDLSYTITNIVCLSIGITCFLLILSFVNYELSFVNFNKNKDRLYRVNYDIAMVVSQSVSPSVM